MSTSKPSFGQQILRSFRPRAAAPLASSATASPAQRPIDHQNLDIDVSSPSPLPIIANIQVNPFDIDPSPISPLPPPTSASASSIDSAPNPFRTHLVELIKPLPLNEPKRTQAIQDSCARLQAIARQTELADPAPPQGQVFRLCIAILGGQDEQMYPTPIKEAACDLLIKAVKHSDEKAAAAPKALIETRSGAPGSQSSKSLDSDQPLANIDRALLYRLVVQMTAHAPPSDSPLLPTKDNLALTSLPCLHVKLRALHILSKDGKDVVAFDGMVQLLTGWLLTTWKEIQALRQLAHFVNNAPDNGEPPESGPSRQPIDKLVFIEQLANREWSMRAILHLLTSTLKFNFARVDHSHVEHALNTIAGLFLEPLPAEVIAAAGLDREVLETSQVSPALHARRSSMTGPSGESIAAARSRSRDRRLRPPSLDGYSYYGLETITPESGPSSANSPIIDPRLGPRTGSAVAPINLATLPPASGTCKRQPSQLSRTTTSAETSAGLYPELQDVEVRAVLVLLDTALTYGYMPPKCVPFVSEMLCRILGVELVAAIASSPLANPPRGNGLTPWQKAALPVLSNLLRSHSANNSLQVVRSLLLTPETQDQSAGPAQSQTRDKVEEEAVLVGAVLFLRMALLITARSAAESAGTGGGPAAGGAPGVKENALAPHLSFALVLPALRGALSRQLDLVDLEVVSLVEALLIPPQPILKGDSIAPLIPLDSLRIEEWNELLQLTSVAKRHLDDWQLGSANDGEASQIPAVLNALVNLIGKLPLASPDQLTAQQPETATAGRPLSLPWTPKLGALLLSLAPALPTNLTLQLIDYHRAHHLCLPCTPDWIVNLQKLLNAFLYGHFRLTTSDYGEARGMTAPAAASTWWHDQPRQACASLLLDHTYESVVSFPHHRAELVRRIILPTAQSILAHETSLEIEEKMRKVLVQAASLSSAASDDAEGAGLDIFNAVRELLSKLARSPEPSSGHAHVHFADQPDPHEHHTSGIPRRAAFEKNVDQSSDTAPDARLAASKSMRSALDLISLFNQIAFSCPWFDFENRNSLREEQEKKAHDGCIAIFRDLLQLVRPNAPQEHAEPLASAQTKLAILQWFLRIRTDRHHRVYLTDDLDDLIAPSAAIILKTPDSRAAATAAEANQANVDKARAARAEGREGRRTTVSVEAAVTRSKSRAREASRERGRAADRAVESPRRADRSASANRALNAKKPAAEHESLWQIPQRLAFEKPSTSLRSDIIYTYIHKDDPSCTHSHPEGESPLPLPVSDLLATYIKIIAVEKEWELVSYVICHLPPQLANKHLFCGPKAQLQVGLLRQHLCSTILQSTLMGDVVLPDDIKRSDVYAVAYATLTTLLSYRALFTRSQQDEMVEAFIAGLNKSQVTAQPCVRALSVAVYEAQKSVTRLLPSMLVKLSTIMSSMTMSVHILELIATIAQIPSCYANFTEAEYRRVFGIALQYIQYHQSPAAAAREDFRASPASFVLSQYVMMLAYYNISLWFMTLRLSDRPKHMHAITRGLELANEGREQLSDQSEVCFDFLSRFAHSNADPKPKRSFLNSVVMDPNGPLAVSRKGAAATKEPERTSKTWLIGKGLVTITSLRKEGWVEIMVRRASGNTALLCKLENAPVTVLPDEDGERVDLPASLMMDRDANVAAQSVFQAPRPYKSKYVSRDRFLEPEAADEFGEPENAVSLRQEAVSMLLVGERLRGKRPLGPASQGLVPRRRAVSFTELSEPPILAVKPLSEDGPYSLGGQGETNSQDETLTENGADDDPVESFAAGKSVVESDEISKVMKDILDEGTKLIGTKDDDQDAEAAGGAAKYNVGSGPFSSSRDCAVDPSTILLQLSSYPDFMNRTPILLPDEPATTRLLKGLDLIPVLDLHKIGCVYVGPGQTAEAEILANTYGSPAYMRFLSGLGELVTLKGQTDLYTGGLDRENDIHGKYAYAFRDDISQIIFHVATMMPSGVGGDESVRRRAATGKKALIGNDWVHIVWNESGSEYQFGTIPSQFNYVNIVISPTTKGGTALGVVSPLDTTFYRVSLQRRPGLPSFSPIGDGQLLSAGALPHLVRILALNANVLSQIYNDTGESMQPYSSNWCTRLNHIVRYKKQSEAKQERDRRAEMDLGGDGEDEDGAGWMQEDNPRDFTTYT